MQIMPDENKNQQRTAMLKRLKRAFKFSLHGVQDLISHENASKSIVLRTVKAAFKESAGRPSASLITKSEKKSFFFLPNRKVNTEINLASCRFHLA